MVDRRATKGGRVTAGVPIIRRHPSAESRSSVLTMVLEIPSSLRMLATAVERPLAGLSAGELDSLVARLFTEEAANLVRLARFFVDDRTAAEDLVQEAFIRLTRSIHRIHDQAKVKPYLRSIVLNLARDHNRRGLMSLRHHPPADPDPPAIDEMMEADEDRRRVIAALRALTRGQRNVLVLRFYMELSVRETADTLGLSVNTVKTQQQRGLAALGAMLEAGGQA